MELKGYIRIYNTIVKPIFDWLVALFSLVLLLPLFIAIAIAVKVNSKGPVFYVQDRLGKNGRIFKIIKFRSMFINMKPPESKKVLESDPRITAVGKFIRKTSLDELPQLINILKGEMSFIGPRPPVINYPKKYEDYNDFEKQRFLVKPGIGGLAQVRCREVHNWDVTIPIDIEYVQNFSIKNDIKLFFISFTFFFRTNNIYEKNPDDIQK